MCLPSQVALESKDVKQLRQLCQDEQLQVREPLLFGKKAYLVGELGKVKAPPSGLREFVRKKLEKPDYVRNEVMSNQMANIKRFKETLENAKMAAAQAQLAEKEKDLSAKFKKVAWERKQGRLEAQRAARRAEKERLKEEAKQAKRAKQIEEELAKREAEKLEKQKKAEQEARRQEAEAEKQRRREEALATEQARQLEQSSQNDRLSELFNAVVDDTRRGTWVVVWGGPVRVRELPRDSSRSLAFYKPRDYVEAVGVVTCEDDGREWLKLAAPDKGFVLIGGGQGAGATAAPIVEMVTHHVGYNGYQQSQWDAQLELLADFKTTHGHTHVWPSQSNRRLAHSSRTSALPDAQRVVVEDALHTWLGVQRQLDTDGRLSQGCAAKLKALEVTTDVVQARGHETAARERAQARAEAADKDALLVSQNDFDDSRGGVWEVVWEGIVRVRDEPSAAAKAIGYKTQRQRVQGLGVVTNTAGEEWLQLGPSERGFMLVDNRPLADGSQGASSSAPSPSNLARVNHQVGVNGYDMPQWQDHLAQLAAYKEQHGHTRVPEGETMTWTETDLHAWVQAQRDLAGQGKLPSACLRQLDELDSSWY